MILFEQIIIIAELDIFLLCPGEYSHWYPCYIAIIECHREMSESFQFPQASEILREMLGNLARVPEETALRRHRRTMEYCGNGSNCRAGPSVPLRRRFRRWILAALRMVRGSAGGWGSGRLAVTTFHLHIYYLAPYAPFFSYSDPLRGQAHMQELWPVRRRLLLLGLPHVLDKLVE